QAARALLHHDYRNDSTASRMRSLYALHLSFRSPFRPHNRAYAYRGVTAFVPLSMVVSAGVC
ncbi:MAG: hypothetical protein KZQ66_07050, partial [Candidatus Thiodiazotropha sp. (ex Lucinoma aequizonata)]|nr:hypothetical protein [Candidatus Thiodiazotropha sp. (ex Lucinoma aequizonata)]